MCCFSQELLRTYALYKTKGEQMTVAQPMMHGMEECIRLCGEIGKEKLCPVSSTAHQFAPSHIFGI